MKEAFTLEDMFLNLHSFSEELSELITKFNKMQFLFEGNVGFFIDIVPYESFKNLKEEDFPQNLILVNTNFNPFYIGLKRLPYFDYSKPIPIFLGGYWSPERIRNTPFPNQP